MTDLVIQLGIVERELVREVVLLVGTVMLFFIAWYSIVALANSLGIFKKWSVLFRRYPFRTAFCTFIAAPMIVYGATKALVLTPAKEQCDYQIGSWTEMIGDYVGYVRFTGDTFPTNILLACCDRQVTNEVTFTQNGQFYYETAFVAGIDLRENKLWVRDSETNDWVSAVVDVYAGEFYDIDWVYGWSGAIAHLPDYGDPRDYRYWFIGPQSNLPEKIVEGGVEIVIDKMIRTAHGLHIEFHPVDSSLLGKVFTLQVRRTVDGVLWDWENIATTMTGVLDVPGNFVQEYNRIRIYCDKEDAR